jgi:hypothetical protein
MRWPEKFRAAIEKGVRDIKGKLCPLNAPEKRQLLATLRERGDCPPKWKNIDPKKQKGILDCLHKAIERLLDPEKAKAASARNAKKRKENGEQEATIKKYKESGQQKVWDDRKGAKRAKAIREANAQAILENKDHHDPTWPEDTLEKKATEIVEMIVEKCGRNGFVHVFGGAWSGQDLNEAVEAESFGKGSHAVFIDGGRRVHYHHVSDHVKLLIPYTGTNCLNADDLEERVQKKLIDMGWPQHRRMFVHAGKGTCKGPATGWTTIPFPYYTGVLVCEQSMEQIGIRRATKKDHAPKRKRSSSSLQKKRNQKRLQNV